MQDNFCSSKMFIYFLIKKSAKQHEIQIEKLFLIFYKNISSIDV